MRKVLLTSAVALGFVVQAAAAWAAPIASGSNISFSDGANYTSTSITFLNNGSANVPDHAASGSFSAFANGCISCALFTSFTFAPFTDPTSVYTASFGGVSTSFTLTSLTSVSSGANFLNLEGGGTLTLTGFDPTPGTFFLSAQGPQGMNVSFSATSLASSVPEPASLAIIGAGLLGLGLTRRKRS